MSAKITSLETKSTKTIKCPICLENSIYPHSPFCSRRCSQLDLGRWLNEAYVISAPEVNEETDLDGLILIADEDLA